MTIKNDILIAVQMKHGWINHNELAHILDLPGWRFSYLCRRYVKELERVGLIESRKLNRHWEYRYIEPLPKISEVGKKKFKRVKHFE